MSGIVGNLFGSKGARAESSTPTAFQSLPQFAQDAFKSGVERAQSLSMDPSMFTPVALNADQTAAADMIRKGYTDVTPETFGQQMAMFTNPFEDSVLANVFKDIRREGQGLFSDIGASASDAGAFGGTRQATLEGQLANNLLEQLGKASSTLRFDNFNAAADRSLANIGQMNANKAAFQSDLGSLGDYFSGRDTAAKQAPMEAINYLLAAAQGIPAGGGGVSLGAQSDAGFLGRASEIAKNFGSAYAGMTGAK